MSDASVIDEKDLKRRMEGALANLKNDFGGLRTGRASASIIDPLTAEAYGSPTPIDQLATVSVPEPRMINVQVWDKSVVGAVEKAIRESDLGLNPIVEGPLLRIPIPELNEERRRDMVKVAHKYAEQAKVAIRHVRRDGMEQLKKAEKDGDISKDDHRTLSDKIQSITDEMVKKVDDAVSDKETEIMQV